MALDPTNNYTDQYTLITHKFSVPDSLMAQTTPMETTLTESLLTPGLQTTIKVNSYLDSIPIKDLNQYKNSTIEIDIVRAINGKYGVLDNLQVNQRVYRLGMLRNTSGRPGTRKLMNDSVEEFTIHACDPTLLNDAETLVTKTWPCTDPSSIVSEMLGCVKARSVDVEPSCCPRDYAAQCIHPFQVINQQAEAALKGDSPSYIHYMTYERGGTHKFRSLDSLVTQTPIGVNPASGITENAFEYVVTGAAAGGYANPRGIMTYNFPCDFDLLADLLNGLGPNGADLSALIAFNPFIKGISGFGTLNQIGCAKGSTVLKAAMTNMGSSGMQLSCPDYAPYYSLKRQARMSLLEVDKLALNMIVPWNPELNAGKVLRLVLKNKVDGTLLNFGSGDYLIHTVTHTIRYGGMATTTLDCVSTTVGQGIQ